jgi:hypothetical protein
MSFGWAAATKPTETSAAQAVFNIDLSLRKMFAIRERLKLEIAANVLNHTELNGNFSGGLGSTILTNNPSAGLIPGYGNSSSYGTIGTGTFDPRQVVMQARINF